MDDILATTSCPIKINTTLHVLARRNDGYHDIYSLFWKKYATEVLTISTKSDENTCDDLNVCGADIKGPNLVMQVIEAARMLYGSLPPLSVELVKRFPTGSGVGAGSGNAAGMIAWLREYLALSDERSVFAKLGADIAFLSGRNDMALVSGIGEKIEPLNRKLDLIWVLVFPAWRSGTAEAYAKLDRYRALNEMALPASDFRGEAFEILGKLLRKERVGLLPNDFLQPLAEEHEEYAAAGHIAADSGALGWGLCGSGSAYFALCRDISEAERLSSKFKRQNWVTQTNIVE